jgi:hypothetical protein
MQQNHVMVYKNNILLPMAVGQSVSPLGGLVFFKNHYPLLEEMSSIVYDHRHNYWPAHMV